MTPTDPRKEYISSRVASATPVELTRMLFEGAVQAVQEAIAANGAGDIHARGNAVTRAVQILGELRFSLRRDVAPQYCDTLSGLYGYLQNRLIQGHAGKSESMLREVLQLIQTLLDGWSGAMRNLDALDAAIARGPEAPAEPPALSVSSPYSSPYPATAPAAEIQNRSWEF
jgi:flagellar secretion chaperone FliS